MLEKSDVLQLNTRRDKLVFAPAPGAEIGSPERVRDPMPEPEEDEDDSPGGVPLSFSKYQPLAAGVGKSA